jgi:DNA-binding transcriptional regulator YiaG
MQKLLIRLKLIQNNPSQVDSIRIEYNPKQFKLQHLKRLFITMTNFELELERFFKQTNTHKISDLAIALEVSPTTIRTWRTRQKIPDTAYRKLELAFKEIEGGGQISKDELKNSLMEGLFTAIQIRAITLAEDAKISLVADILIKEITENHKLAFGNEKEKRVVK